MILCSQDPDVLGQAERIQRAIQEEGGFAWPGVTHQPPGKITPAADFRSLCPYGVLSPTGTMREDFGSLRFIRRNPCTAF